MLLENSLRMNRKGHKMENRWLGPYIISKVFEKNLYQLKHPRTGNVLARRYNAVLKITGGHRTMFD